MFQRTATGSLFVLALFNAVVPTMAVDECIDKLVEGDCVSDDDCSWDNGRCKDTAAYEKQQELEQEQQREQERLMQDQLQQKMSLEQPQQDVQHEQPPHDTAEIVLCSVLGSALLTAALFVARQYSRRDIRPHGANLLLASDDTPEE